MSDRAEPFTVSYIGGQAAPLIDGREHAQRLLVRPTAAVVTPIFVASSVAAILEAIAGAPARAFQINAVPPQVFVIAPRQSLYVGGPAPATPVAVYTAAPVDDLADACIDWPEFAMM